MSVAWVTEKGAADISIKAGKKHHQNIKSQAKEDLQAVLLGTACSSIIQSTNCASNLHGLSFSLLPSYSSSHPNNTEGPYLGVGTWDRYAASVCYGMGFLPLHCLPLWGNLALSLLPIGVMQVGVPLGCLYVESSWGRVPVMRTLKK